MVNRHSHLDHYAPAKVRGVLPVSDGWLCLSFDQCGHVVRMRLPLEEARMLLAAAGALVHGPAQEITLPQRPRSAATVSGGTEPVCSMRSEHSCIQRPSFSALNPAQLSVSSKKTICDSSSSTADCHAVEGAVVLDIGRVGVGY